MERDVSEFSMPHWRRELRPGCWSAMAAVVGVVRGRCEGLCGKARWMSGFENGVEDGGVGEMREVVHLLPQYDKISGLY